MRAADNLGRTFDGHNPLLVCGCATNTYPPPSKNLPNATLPGRHPPSLDDGTHSSFLHTILDVWLTALHLRCLRSSLVEDHDDTPASPSNHAAWCLKCSLCFMISSACVHERLILKGLAQNPCKYELPIGFSPATCF